MGVKHFCLDSEYDVSWCRSDVLGGGEVNISEVNCAKCLFEVSKVGHAATLRISELLLQECYAIAASFKKVG